MALNDEQVFAAWSQGKRERQEDFYGLARLLPATAETAPDVLVVADGMGGQAAGDLASKAAVDSFLQSLGAGAERPAAQRLREGLSQANAAVGQQANADPSRAGMGTTLVAIELRGDAAHWISVGDSPFYLLRGDELTRQNADHSLAGLHMEMAARGEISEAEARARGGANQLRSALMGGEISLIDTNGLDPGLALKPGDVIILASDGVITLVDDTICDIALKHRRSAKNLAKALVAAVDKANKPRQDNATVIVYVHPGEPPPLGKRRKKARNATSAPRSSGSKPSGDIAIALGIAVAATLALAVWAAVSLIGGDDSKAGGGATETSAAGQTENSPDAENENAVEDNQEAQPTERQSDRKHEGARLGGEDDAKPNKRAL